MCRGLEEANQRDFFRRLPIPKEVVQPDVLVGSVSCELCGKAASVYCEADRAYLCRKCDQKVHGANFLAYRHIRCFLCNKCNKFIHRYLIGVSNEVVLPFTMSWAQRNLCNSTAKTNCSKRLKRPFLHL